MNIIIWLTVGCLIGWAANRIMRTDAQLGIVLNVTVGIVGATLGGWFLSSAVGGSTIDHSNFSGPGLLVPLLGAVMLLDIVRLIWQIVAPRRRSPRVELPNRFSPS
jgi:uncharacterized membrane protein YeaQ/YmgE (transglycosylase-associated protein family)